MWPQILQPGLYMGDNKGDMLKGVEYNLTRDRLLACFELITKSID